MNQVRSFKQLNRLSQALPQPLNIFSGNIDWVVLGKCALKLYAFVRIARECDNGTFFFFYFSRESREKVKGERTETQRVIMTGNENVCSRENRWAESHCLSPSCCNWDKMLVLDHSQQQGLIIPWHKPATAESNIWRYGINTKSQVMSDSVSCARLMLDYYFIQY